MDMKNYLSLVEDFDSLFYKIDFWKRDRLKDILFSNMGMFNMRKSEDLVALITEKEEEEISGYLDDAIESYLDEMEEK